MTSNEPTYSWFTDAICATAGIGFVSFFLVVTFVIRTGGEAAGREGTTRTRDIRAGAVNIANDRDGNGAGSTRFAAIAGGGAGLLVTLARTTFTMRDGRATDAAITTLSIAETTAALTIIRGATMRADPRATR